MPRSAKKPRGVTPTAVTPYKTGQPVAAPTGLPYGEHQALTDAQHAAPLAGPSTMPAPPDAMAAAQAHPAAPIGLVGPTARPDEPITAGLDSGPGPGPEALGQQTNDPVQQLRAIYAIAPNPDLLDLISHLGT